MKNYVEYKELKLKINAERTLELESKLGAAISEKIKELDKLSVAAEFIAAAIQDGTYDERKKEALAIFDELTDEGKGLNEYQYIIMDVLVAAGFMNGEAVRLQKMAAEQQKNLIAETLKKFDA